MRPLLSHTITRKLQKIFWVYLTNNGIVTSMNDFKIIQPSAKCAFRPITLDNYFRVQDFREQERISEYREKLDHKEIGYFAEMEGKMVGSIWTTINNSEVPVVVRKYMKLMPNEAIAHDGVTGEMFRGMGVGSFMVGSLAFVLLDQYKVSKIMFDVNIRNSASLRMVAKAGIQTKETVLYVSTFGKLLFQKVLKHFPD
jgi:hypothetical protein